MPDAVKVNKGSLGGELYMKSGSRKGFAEELIIGHLRRNVPQQAIMETRTLGQALEATSENI